MFGVPSPEFGACPLRAGRLVTGLLALLGIALQLHQADPRREALWQLSRFLSPGDGTSRSKEARSGQLEQHPLLERTDNNIWLYI